MRDGAPFIAGELGHADPRRRRHARRRGDRARTQVVQDDGRPCEGRREASRSSSRSSRRCPPDAVAQRPTPTQPDASTTTPTKPKSRRQQPAHDWLHRRRRRYRRPRGRRASPASWRWARTTSEGQVPGRRRVREQDGVDANDSAKSLGLVSTIAFGAGAALLIGGAVLIFTAPKGPSKEARAVKVLPTATASGGGVFLSGSF